MQYEQWMLTKYKIQSIDEDLLKMIQQPQPDLKGKVIDIPPKNSMLPTKFEMVPTEEEYTNVPKFISDIQDLDIWFRQET